MRNWPSEQLGSLQVRKNFSFPYGQVRQNSEPRRQVSQVSTQAGLREGLTLADIGRVIEVAICTRSDAELGDWVEVGIRRDARAAGIWAQTLSTCFVTG